MHKLILFLAGTIFGLAVKTVIDEIESPSIEDIITAHRGQADDPDAETANEAEPIQTRSMIQTP